MPGGTDRRLPRWTRWIHQRSVSILTDQTDSAVQARRREIAAEHVLFKTLEYVEARHPGLLDHIEASLDHLGDYARDDTKDDEAVRAIARTMLQGARREGTS